MNEARTEPTSSQDEPVQYGPCLKGQFQPPWDGDPVRVSAGVSPSGKSCSWSRRINAHFYEGPAHAPQKLLQVWCPGKNGRAFHNAQVARRGVNIV